jgi:DNA-binding transcriptional regulator LsrR (DeoR family)
MARPRTITEDQKLLIALMHSESRMTNDAIAARMHISPSSVSKIIQGCFDEGRLRLVFSRDGLSPEQLESLNDLVTGTADLKRRLAALEKDPAAAVHEPEVRVFDSGGNDTTPAGWAARLEAFGRAAAPFVGDQIANANVVGTSWGDTPAAVIRAIGDRPPLRPKHPIQFFGVCGEMLDGPPRKVSASSLAHRLDQIVNGDPQHSHCQWLAGVPSRLPEPGPGGKGLNTEECDAVRHYIRLLPGYRRVFGAHPDGGRPGPREKPLIDRVDLILTSCGPKERPLGYRGAQELLSTGLSLREAHRLVLGDISGYLLKNPKVDDRGRIAAINSRLVSTNLLEKFRACSARALAGRGGGTVLCAVGANKAEALLEILRLGLATIIVVDLDLARALSRLLPPLPQES